MSGILVFHYSRTNESSFEAPDDVSLDELKSVKLGNSVAFDVQPN